MELQSENWKKNKKILKNKKINAFLKHLGELILKIGDQVRSFHLLGPTTVN